MHYLIIGIHTFLYADINSENLLHISRFYVVIMSLILITFSFDLCIDTIKRDLMLVTLGT